MVTFIKIDKEGKLNQDKLDNINNLYKKCGLRKAEGFEVIHTYTKGDMVVELWSRNSGRANSKNSYNYCFENVNIYGAGAILMKENIEYKDFSIELYNKICTEFEDSKIEDKNIDNKVENSDLESDSESDSDTDTEDDSELKKEDYIYSSEEEL